MSETTLLIMAAIFGGGGILGGIISLVTLFVNRKESKARIDNFTTNTEEIRNQIVKDLKEQLAEQNKELKEQNKTLLAEKKELTERVDILTQQIKEKDEQYLKDQERWRVGYRKLEDRIRANENDLRSERENNSRLVRELDDTKRENKKTAEGYIVKIGELEGQLATHQSAILELKTGQLPAREDLKQK